MISNSLSKVLFKDLLDVFELLEIGTVYYVPETSISRELEYHKVGFILDVTRDNPLDIMKTICDRLEYEPDTNINQELPKTLRVSSEVCLHVSMRRSQSFPFLYLLEFHYRFDDKYPIRRRVYISREEVIGELILTQYNKVRVLHRKTPNGTSEFCEVFNINLPVYMAENTNLIQERTDIRDADERYNRYSWVD